MIKQLHYQEFILMCFGPKLNIIHNFLNIFKHIWTLHQNLSHPILIHATNEVEKNQALAGKGKVKDEFPRLRLMRLFFTSLSSQFLYLMCVHLILEFQMLHSFRRFFFLTFSCVLGYIFAKLPYNHYKHMSYILYASQHRQSLIHWNCLFYLKFFFFFFFCQWFKN